MKINKVLTIATIISLATASCVFAAAGTTQTITDAGGSFGTPAVSVKPSKGVTVVYKPEVAGLAYSMGASHSSGSKTYATSSGDTKIFMAEGVAVAPPAPPAAGGDTADFSGSWTSL